MAQQNVDFGRAWQLLRTKRVITLATLPDWNEADKRLKKLADYRVWCREQPIGCFQGYKITVPFNAGGGSSVRTKGLGPGDSTQRIHFPNMDAQGDPYYQHLTEKKDELIHSSTWDADVLGQDDDEGDTLVDPDEAKRREAIRYALRLYEPWNDENDISQDDVAGVVEDYSASWVGNRVREWKEGEHRELVPDPEDN